MDNFSWCVKDQQGMLGNGTLKWGGIWSENFLRCGPEHGKKPSRAIGLSILHKCTYYLCRGFKDEKLRLAEARDQVVNDSNS